MQNLLDQLVSLAQNIDKKIIEDFDDPKIFATYEIIHLYEILEQTVHQLKTFRDKAENYSLNNSPPRKNFIAKE